MDRCKRYIGKLRDAVSGNDGHGATLQAACECYRFGLSESDAMGVMLWFNDTKTAGDPWNERELKHKLDDARKKHLVLDETRTTLASIRTDLAKQKTQFDAEDKRLDERDVALDKKADSLNSLKAALEGRQANLNTEAERLRGIRAQLGETQKIKI